MSQLSDQVQSKNQGASVQVSSAGINQYPERLWAAWQAGRLVNELRFRMKQAWLTNLSDEVAPVGDLFRELINDAHRIPDLRQSGALLGDAIELECSVWKDNFGGETHKEAHCKVVERFRLYSTEPGCTDEQVRWALCEYLQPVDLMCRSLGDRLRSSMDENQLRFYEFASFIDRTLHPTNEDVLLDVDVWSGVHAKNRSASEAKVKFGGEAPHPDPSRWQLPSIARKPNYEILASDNWIVEIQGRWSELEFSDAPLRALLANSSAASVTNANTIVPLADKIARQLNEAVRLELNVHRIPLQRASRIWVDVKNLKAYLDGQPYPLDSRKVALFLDQIVHESGNWISSSEMVRTIHELEGVRLDRLKIPDEINALIESRPGGGYRLQQTALTGNT